MLPLAEETTTFQLLPRKLIKEAHAKFSLLHLGLVHVAIKPCHREGLSASILITLQDKHFNRFEDSLLGCITSLLCDGSVYFNCYPNFFQYLTDLHIFDPLTFKIRSYGYDVKDRVVNM